MQSESTNKSQKNNKRRILIVCFVAFFLLGIYFLIGKPMIAFVDDADGFQEYVKNRGIFGLLAFGFFVFLQTLSNCIPGLPFYLAAGAAFGGIKGAIICDIFATMANTTAFLLGKKYGRDFLLLLFPKSKLEQVENLVLNKNPVLVHVLFMLLPLPKDTYAWLGFYSKENVIQWILITFVARFPHIFIYTFGAEKMLENQYSYIAAGAIIAVVVYLTVAMLIKKKTVNSGE